MSDDLSQLDVECRRAADEFLSLDWGYSKPRVVSAVNEMLAGSRLYNASMAFLLRESIKLPVQAEPARRLNDLVSAIRSLRIRQRQLEACCREGLRRDLAV
jgi:hypothetical protein